MNEFIKYLQEKDFTPSTQNGYLNSVNKFLKWYNLSRNGGNDEPMNAEKKDILKYLEYLKKNKKQNNHSRNCELISLKHYFEFLRKSGQIATNPTALIKIRGTKRKQLYNIYTAEELTRLADDYYTIYIKNIDDSKIPKSTRQRSVLGNQRNYLMLTFLIYQGLPTNELQKIQLDDTDLIKATVRITKGKKSNERIIPLKAEQIGILMNYLQNIRPQFLEHYKEETNQLFLLLPEHNESRKISTNYNNIFLTLRYQIKKINENFLNFKQVRASVITSWIKTAGLRKAQYLAGHRYISSTEKYLPNDLEQLTDDIEKFNPFSF